MTDIQRKDLFDLLVSDHQRIAKRIEDLKQAPADRSEGVFSLLDNDLTRHMDMEELYLYPELEEVDELNDIISGSLSDHEGMKDLLQRMASLDPTRDEWKESLESLEDAKEIHVHTEEREVFPRAMKLLDQAQIDRMTDAIAAAIQKNPQLLQVRRPTAPKPTPGV